MLSPQTRSSSVSASWLYCSGTSNRLPLLPCAVSAAISEKIRAVFPLFARPRMSLSMWFYAPLCIAGFSLCEVCGVFSVSECIRSIADIRVKSNERKLFGRIFGWSFDWIGRPRGAIGRDLAFARRNPCFEKRFCRKAAGLADSNADEKPGHFQLLFSIPRYTYTMMKMI